jgi:uncharacterized membrane protein YdjX (TVP38/TMEM64 family)
VFRLTARDDGAAAALPSLPAGGPGVALALGAWALLTPAMFPGTVLALASGLAFGALGGGAVACLGGTLGGCAAFALARAGAGPAPALAREGTRVRAVVARVERRGPVGVALLRAAPGMPATALHYVCGLTRLRARDFAAGIALGSAPRALAYAAIGGGLGAHGGVSPALVAGGAGTLAVTAVAGGLLARRVRRAAT